MARVSREEFARLPLRVHGFLADVPLYDVWAVDLPHAHGGATVHEFLPAAHLASCKLSPATRALLGLRLFAGRLLGWDREPSAITEVSFANRMTSPDRSRSLVPVGTKQGLFRVVYQFENERLLEMVNRIAHAGALSALIERENGYRFYLAVYVQNTSGFTPMYMALISPFRKFIVYPSLLRSVRSAWNEFCAQRMRQFPEKSAALRDR